MFLTLVVSVMAFCFSCGDEQVQESTNNGQTERPNTEDYRPKITDIPNVYRVEYDDLNIYIPFWQLNIIKFKKPEYKDHIMARYFIHVDSTLAINKFLITMASPYDCYNCHDYSTQNHHIFVKTIPTWEDVTNDYVLCHWRWQPSLNEVSSGRSHKTQYNANNYGYEGVEYEYTSDVVILQDTWNKLPDSVFDNAAIYDITGDVMRYKSLVLDSDPLLEHYVVRADYLFRYMNRSYDAIDSCYVPYTPCGGEQWAMCELEYLKNELHYPVGNDTIIYTNKYDSLFDEIRSMLETIIEQGKLEEFLEYQSECSKSYKQDSYPRWTWCIIA